MTFTTELFRRQEKIIALTDSTPPTVPTVANHTLPGWLDTDIYKGELAFSKFGSTYKFYSRDETGIFEISRKDEITAALSAIQDDLAQEVLDRIANETYTHNQAVPSASWVINHNLGRKPSVTVIDSAGDECAGLVDYTSSNSLTLTFSAAFSGYAYLN